MSRAAWDWVSPLSCLVEEKGYIPKYLGRTTAYFFLCWDAPKDESRKTEYQNNIRAHIESNVFRSLAICKGLYHPNQKCKV